MIEVNKIYNADCMDILKQLPDKSVDLILTDPPYFKIKSEEWDNQWKNITEFQQWVEKLAVEFKRVLKDNGSFYWFGDDKVIAYCQVIFDKYFNLLNNLVWHKINGMCQKGTGVYRCYAPVTERILFYDKGEDKTGLTMLFNSPDLFLSIKTYMRAEKDKLKKEKGFKTEQEFKEFIDEVTNTRSVVSRHYFADSQYTFPTAEIYAKLQSTGFFQRPYKELRAEYEELRRVWNPTNTALDVLNFPIISGKTIHPTQKPISIIQYLIERSSKQGQTVLDCFSGSGTTAIACHNLNRRFICIEKNYDYWKASCERLKEHQSQLRLF